mgnify:CR=1 FL=1
MTQGVVHFALNNLEVDYIKQAVFCAKKIKEHLKLPVALVTCLLYTSDAADE